MSATFDEAGQHLAACAGEAELDRVRRAQLGQVRGAVQDFGRLGAVIPPEIGVDARNRQGLTALMVACAGGNETMAFELVEGKSDVNALHQQQGQPDRTAMDMAACAKRSDIIEILKRHGGFGLCERTAKGDGFQLKKHRRG